MNHLYNYVFWHNHYEELWYAIPKDQYTQFFSGYLESKGVLKSRKIETLIYMVQNPQEIPQK